MSCIDIHPVCVSNSLSDVSLDIAENRATGQDRAFPVEQCNCPPQYRGLSCEVGQLAAVQLPSTMLQTVL